ncbi:hypothetical protein IF1G_08597 [Cordyceps javanica]|uniref:Uncharacterized protein n=1 Tax=Cordyceps javanica TaxID=43265 RepID=A0A545UT78_9HYPO|nr:hypothetical protein IF1G_08597 [Cordyceps javanica]
MVHQLHLHKGRQVSFIRCRTAGRGPGPGSVPSHCRNCAPRADGSRSTGQRLPKGSKEMRGEREKEREGGREGEYRAQLGEGGGELTFMYTGTRKWDGEELTREKEVDSICHLNSKKLLAAVGFLEAVYKLVPLADKSRPPCDAAAIGPMNSVVSDPKKGTITCLEWRAMYLRHILD